MIDSSSTRDFLHDFIIESVSMEAPDGTNNGKAVIRFTGKNAGYEMRVEMKNGKKEGPALILRDNGTIFMKLTYVNDIAEGEVIKKSKFGKTVLKGTLEKGKEVGLFTEYDEDEKETWRGFYRNGERYSAIEKCWEKLDSMKKQVCQESY